MKKDAEKKVRTVIEDADDKEKKLMTKVMKKVGKRMPKGK